MVNRRAASDLTWFPDMLRATALWFLTSVPIFLGVWFGSDYVPRRTYNDFPGFMVSQPPPGLLRSFANWDGVWHAEIAARGYRHDPSQGSYVVFFPGYPLLGGIVAKLCRVNEVAALLLVSQLCLITSVFTYRRYLLLRYAELSGGAADVAVVTLLLFPTTFFFRMAYGESLFLLLVALTLLGVERRWPLFAVALTIGAATGVRAAGIGLVGVWAYYIWQRCRESATTASGYPLTTTRRLGRLAVSMVVTAPLCVWGLLGYTVYLGARFGDPIAFHSNHAKYDARPHTPPLEKAINLVSLEPIREVYDRDSPWHWTAYEPVVNPAFILRFLNPVYFLAACGLVVLGAWKRWLNGPELWLSAGLLGVAYVTKGHDNVMVGTARYAAVVLPAYATAAQLLLRAPEALRTALLAIAAALLALYSALFAAWHVFI